MAFWRNIGRFGHTSCNYKREKVFWGKWFFNEGLAACTWVNIRQPAHEVTMKYPTSSRALQAAWEKLLARRSHRVNFVQINTGIPACSREGGCDRPKDNKSTNIQVSNTKNVFKGACGVCTKGENSISLKGQEMTRRQSNQKKCIADQKRWSQSTFFDLQKNPYLPHNLKALDKGHVSRFFFPFECKHLKDAVSLWTGRPYTYKRKSFFPKHHTKIHAVSFPQQFQQNSLSTVWRQKETQLQFTSREATYKINCSEASMANLSEICEELFWIFFEEELCNFGVLQAARSAGWWHPAGQLADRLSGFKVLPQPLAHLYEWSLFSMDHCKKKIASLHWLSSAQRHGNKAVEEQPPLLPEQATPFHEAAQPICRDVEVPMRHRSGIYFYRTQFEIKAQNEARSCPSICSASCTGVSRIAAITSLPLASPFYSDILSLKSYTCH